jgi:hypothetical protein
VSAYLAALAHLGAAPHLELADRLVYVITHHELLVRLHELLRFPVDFGFQVGVDL